MKKAKSLAPFLCLFFWAEQAMAVQSDPRLIGHWKMDEAVGVTAVSDSSGVGEHSLSVLGAPSSPAASVTL